VPALRLTPAAPVSVRFVCIAHRWEYHGGTSGWQERDEPVYVNPAMVTRVTAWSDERGSGSAFIVDRVGIRTELSVESLLALFEHGG
jgi:hypothetical protein